MDPDFYTVEFIVLGIAVGVASLVGGVVGAWKYMAEEIREIESPFARGLAWVGGILVLPLLAVLFAVFGVLFFFGILSTMALFWTLGPIFLLFSATAYYLRKRGERYMTREQIAEAERLSKTD